MKKKSWIGWTAAFFLMSFASAWSAPVATNTTHTHEYPWYLFIGGDIGYSHYSAYNNSMTEAPRGGFDGGFRGLLAYYSRDWVLDGGFGIQWINNQGTNSDNSINTDHTTNAYIDFSPRYRFAHHTDVNFQLGPELEYWVSSDKGLNPTTTGLNTIADGSNTSAWLGLQGLVEWGDGPKFRAGLRGLTALNVSERSVVLGQVFFQVGFDVFHATRESYSAPKSYERINEDDLDRVEDRSKNDPLSMSPEPTPFPKTAPAEPEPEVLSTPAPPEVEATPYPTPKPLPVPVHQKAPAKVVMTLDVNDLPFGFNNSNLPKSNAARVKKIGEFLKKNNGSWRSLVVAGHTDERGSKEYNLKLSKKRADAVRNLLVQGGANPGKVKTVGFGESTPLDPRHNEKAWTKNRRVELEFKGVKDVVLMKKAMNQ